jgi:hypothetical protein
MGIIWICQRGFNIDSHMTSDNRWMTLSELFTAMGHAITHEHQALNGGAISPFARGLAGPPTRSRCSQAHALGNGLHIGFAGPLTLLLVLLLPQLGTRVSHSASTLSSSSDSPNVDRPPCSKASASAFGSSFARVDGYRKAKRHKSQ